MIIIPPSLDYWKIKGNTLYYVFTEHSACFTENIHKTNMVSIIIVIIDVIAMILIYHDRDC